MVTSIGSGFVLPILLPMLTQSISIIHHSSKQDDDDDDNDLELNTISLKYNQNMNAYQNSIYDNNNNSFQSPLRTTPSSQRLTALQYKTDPFSIDIPDKHLISNQIERYNTSTTNSYHSYNKPSQSLIHNNMLLNDIHTINTNNTNNATFAHEYQISSELFSPENEQLEDFRSNEELIDLLTSHHV